MKARTTILILTALNLVSLGAVGYYFTTRPGEISKQNSPVAVTNAPPRAVSRPLTAASSPSTAKRFHWREVESDDYKTYIGNLRAIGCPEETIRDIIIADVSKLYAPRQAAISTHVKESAYWKTGTQRDRVASDSQRQLRELNKEKLGLLKELLGPDVESDLRKVTFDSYQLNDDSRLGFLPEGKRVQVRDLLDRSQEMEKEIQQRSNGMLTPWDRKELKKIQDQRNADLAALLTPQEFNEYQLRHSTTADAIRRRMAGVDLTEPEFQQLFRMQQELEGQFNNVIKTADRAMVDQRVQAQKNLEDGVKAILGEQRYAEYQRLQDPAYRGLVQVAQNYNLPQDTVDKAYEIKRATDDQRRQLLSERTMPKEQISSALQTVTTEADKALLTLLGENAARDFKENSGPYGFSAMPNARIQALATPGGAAVKMFTLDSGDVLDAPRVTVSPSVKIAAPK